MGLAVDIVAGSSRSNSKLDSQGWQTLLHASSMHAMSSGPASRRDTVHGDRHHIESCDRRSKGHKK